MTDDNLADTQQSSVGTKLEIELLDVVTKNVWNAAIEEAAKYLEIIQGTDTGIRKLKK